LLITSVNTLTFDFDLGIANNSFFKLKLWIKTKIGRIR